MVSIGQLFFTGISGKSLTKDEALFIETYDVGGVILFSNNYESPAQLAELINEIQSKRKEYPLFIGVDHEGGRIIRFKQHFTQFPSMLDISKLKSPKIFFEIYKIMANELSTCGVNVNFAPCCDILTNPSNKVIGDRAFGKSSNEVSKYVSSAIRGLQTNNVFGCAKHFPGHADTSKDTHNSSVILKKSLNDLNKHEFIPFIKAVKARVEFFMMSHIIADGIDQDNPTSLSAKAYNIVRNEMRYTKLIITDDMQMNAITDKYNTEQAAILALKAGADILLYRDCFETKKALDGVNSALKTKELKNTDIQQKLKRIEDCKQRNLKEYKQIYIPTIAQTINQRQSQILLNELNKRIQDLNTQQ